VDGSKTFTKQKLREKAASPPRATRGKVDSRKRLGIDPGGTDKKNINRVCSGEKMKDLSSSKSS